jgi:outer membrane protein assembly factor BamD (BamD/ComL family)
MKGVLNLICIAVMTAFLISGCATIRENAQILEARVSLLSAREQVEKGEFSKAEEEYLFIIKKYPNTHACGDALFELSLLYISPKNKKRDFKKAYDGFKAFLERYPQHRKAEISRHFIVVLKKVESVELEMKELKDVLIKLEMMEKELKK